MPSRKARQQKSRNATTEPAPTCFLCERPMGRKIERHHPVPKSRGGRETAPVHPICHRTIHAALDNKSLERNFASAEALRAHPDIATFITWVRDKDPDFHVPTRQRKRK
ncbi:HNH endonuclease [Sphingomonas deserti]|uniref:HNH endonuclease n=2 Tax=Allosphingosinicella deserti TaxID=2116704 RepID=A0A2P7QV94_9SPHN|nr:HNH endonuclease [Sphingomonas deserti]